LLDKQRLLVIENDLKSGMDMYLTKPCLLDEIPRVLDKLKEE